MAGPEEPVGGLQPPETGISGMDPTANVAGVQAELHHTLHVPPGGEDESVEVMTAK